MVVSERIKQARSKLGLSQTEFGRAAGGVSKAAVSQWERGLTTPERDALMALQRDKALSPEWIMNGHGDMFVARKTEPVTEFEWTYNHVSDEGKKFLMSAIAAAKSAYIVRVEEERKSA